MTLKTFFSSSLAIFCCLDALYCADSISTFVINTSNLCIKKQIFDGVVILIYFKYFLDCLWPCLTGTRDVEVAESAKNAFARGVSTKIAFAEDTSSLNTYIGIKLSSINY